jgi:glycopeptide antibiotics resistance protein
MTNKGKLIFLIVAVIVTLLLKHGFQISENTLMDVFFTTLGGVLAVVIISFLQNRKHEKN